MAGGPKSTNVRSSETLIEGAAKTMRRMRADESYDDEGVRTIWHRGNRAEMLSWEDRDNNILKQELSVFGLVVEYKRGAPLRTGVVPVEDGITSGGQPRSDLIEMDRVPTAETLEHASTLLRLFKKRDYYAQHLLKHVNDTIAQFQFDESRTAVSSLEGFTRGVTQPNIKMKEVERTQIVARPAVESRTRYVFISILLAVVGAAAGAVAAHFLGLITIDWIFWRF